MADIRRATDVKILDGGMGTELVNMGAITNEDALWSAAPLLSAPDKIKAVHKSFLESGSDIILTSTYQASIEGFMEFAGQTREGALDLYATAVRVAREAVEEFWAENQDKDPAREKPVVAASIGPYGASQHDLSEYTGVYADTKTKEELIEWHRPHLEALLKAGLDLIAIETIPCQMEAEALVELLRDYPQAKAWLCYSVKDDKHLWHGETFADAVEAVVGSDQVIGVGCNCCNPHNVATLLSSARAAIGAKPFVVYPDRRIKFYDGRDGSIETPQLETFVPSWLELGARFIGGCCGTRPEDIQKIGVAARTHVLSP